MTSKAKLSISERSKLVRARAYQRKPLKLEAAIVEIYDRGSTVTVGFAKKGVSLARLAAREGER